MILSPSFIFGLEIYDGHLILGYVVFVLGCFVGIVFERLRN